MMNAVPGKSYLWGRSKWRITTLKKGGWGAQCNYHFKKNYDQRRCQKYCTDARFTGEQQRRLCKAWLLAGLAVDEDAEEGQPDHVFGVDVYSLFDELPEEAELDRQAEALADNF